MSQAVWTGSISFGLVNIPVKLYPATEPKDVRFHLYDIDPVFYEKSYQVGPVRGMGAEKPYALLLRAMQGAGMVGIGRFVLRTKPHLVAIRPLKEALALETLFFGDEVRSPAELTSGLSGLAITDRELKTARQLIGAMATEWIPEKQANAYREEHLELLSSKPAAAPAEAI